MTRTRRLIAGALIAFTALVATACNEGGIGVGVPNSGARWGGGATGPDVLVAGGPVFR